MYLLELGIGLIMWHTTLLNHVEGKLEIVCAVIVLLVITNDTDVAIMRYVLTAPPIQYLIVRFLNRLPLSHKSKYS